MSQESFRALADELRALVRTPRKRRPELVARDAIRVFRNAIDRGALVDEPELRGLAHAKRPNLDGMSYSAMPRDCQNVDDDVYAWDCLADYVSDDNWKMQRKEDLGRMQSWIEACEPVAKMIERSKADGKTTRASLPKPCTRPPPKAFQAWQIRELVGISKQGEIANTMTQQGIPATQGQVSKWLKAVEDWRTAGGLMPNVGTLEGEPQSVDPHILDMGARQDGLTPRQRPRRR
jgi:hypothetical protein